MEALKSDRPAAPPTDTWTGDPRQKSNAGATKSNNDGAVSCPSRRKTSSPVVASRGNGVSTITREVMVEIFLCDQLKYLVSSSTMVFPIA